MTRRYSPEEVETLRVLFREHNAGIARASTPPVQGNPNTVRTVRASLPHPTDRPLQSRDDLVDIVLDLAARLETVSADRDSLRKQVARLKKNNRNNNNSGETQ